MSRRAARIGVALAALAGLGGAAALIAALDLAKLGDLLAAAGWGIVLVVPAHVPPMLASAQAWRASARPLWRGGLGAFLWARLLRESIGGILPVTQIGGDVAGAHALTRHGARPVVAGGSLMVDMTLEFLTQIVFVAIGLALLAQPDGGGAAAGRAAAGLAVAVAAAAAFLLAQRLGLLRVLSRLVAGVSRRSGWPAPDALAGLHETTGRLYRAPGAAAQGAAWHLLSWLLGAAEVWLILHLLGAGVGVGGAIIIESFGQAVRSAAFLVPGAIGVQEGGFVLLGVMSGLPPETGLAISLIKRFREIALGAPAVIVWQMRESRRLLRAATDTS